MTRTGGGWPFYSEDYDGDRLFDETPQSDFDRSTMAGAHHGCLKGTAADVVPWVCGQHFEVFGNKSHVVGISHDNQKKTGTTQIRSSVLVDQTRDRHVG